MGLRARTNGEGGGGGERREKGREAGRAKRQTGGRMEGGRA